MCGGEVNLKYGEVKCNEDGYNKTISFVPKCDGDVIIEKIEVGYNEELVGNPSHHFELGMKVTGSFKDSSQSTRIECIIGDKAGFSTALVSVVIDGQYPDCPNKGIYYINFSDFLKNPFGDAPTTLLYYDNEVLDVLKKVEGKDIYKFISYSPFFLTQVGFDPDKEVTIDKGCASYSELISDAFANGSYEKFCAWVDKVLECDKEKGVPKKKEKQDN